MPFIAGDIVLATKDADGTNTNEYTIPAYSFLQDKLYLLYVVGNEETPSDPLNAVGVPVTPGITWTEVDISTRTDGAITCYSGSIASSSSESTVITFPVTQSLGSWMLLEISNASNTVVQFKSGGWNAASGIVTLDSAIATDGLAILAVAKTGVTTANFTVGAGQTGITPLATNIFGSYNLLEDESLEVGTPDGSSHVAIGIEVAFGASTAPVISSPTAAAISGSALSGTFITDGIADGLAYWYVDSDATPPSVADLKLGVGSVASGSQAVTVTGLQTIASMGPLSAGTTYYVHYLHNDGIEDNDSNIITTSATDTLDQTATVTGIIGGESLTGLDFIVFDGQDLETMTKLLSGSGEITDTNGDLVIDLNNVTIGDGDPLLIIIGDWTATPGKYK